MEWMQRVETDHSQEAERDEVEREREEIRSEG